MSRREILERSALGAVAALCLLLALALALLALDVSRSRAAIAAGDVRYRISPETAGLWQASTVVPFDAASAVLGTADDIEQRRAVRSVRLARLDDSSVSVSDPQVALLRNDAQARLDAIIAADGKWKPEVRSRAAGLLGVIGLSRLVTETQDRVALLSATVANLQLAIGLDPSNDDAKYNLELVLQRSRGIDLTEGAGGQNPSPGGSGSSGAGAGDPGSGY